eukprot:2693179-Heterocapsa_arctica.AAC.1
MKFDGHHHDLPLQLIGTAHWFCCLTASITTCGRPSAQQTQTEATKGFIYIDGLHHDLHLFCSLPSSMQGCGWGARCGASNGWLGLAWAVGLFPKPPSKPGPLTTSTAHRTEPPAIGELKRVARGRDKRAKRTLPESPSFELPRRPL